MTILIVLVVLLVVAIGLLIFNLVTTQREDDAEGDRWARRHGFELTDTSRPWVESYLRTGRNLRQIGGFGGLVVAASVTAATGLDLYVSGLVWVLLGYLVGCLWAELALTRAPGGTRRSASLVTRRLGDYLPRRMEIAEVAVPVTALVLGAVVVLTHLEPTIRALAPGELPPTGFHIVSPYATDAAVRQGALTATLMAPLVMAVVWWAQRYLIGRPQPAADPSLIAADDALRSSSTHLLGASGLAAGCLLIGSQLGYLTTVTQGPLQTASIIGLVGSFAAAWVLFRWRRAPWQVRRPALGDPGPTGDPSDSARGPRDDSGPSSGPGAGGATGVAGAAVVAGAAGDVGDPGGPVLAAGVRSGGSAATEVLMTQGTTDPSVTTAVDRPVWSMRRSPVPIAVGLIVLIALAGWGLRTWGPINPAIDVYDNGLGTDGHGAPTAWLQVHNGSRAPVEITSMVTLPSSSSGAGPLVAGLPLIRSVSVTITGQDEWHDATMPIEVPGGTFAQLALSMGSDAVSCPTGALQAQPFDVELTYRTASGRSVHRRVSVVPVSTIDCIPPLPTGTPPADPAAAEAAVRAAAATVYDPSAGAARLDAIDDPRGVAEANAEVLAGPYAESAATTTVTLGEVSFDRPDHAWFHYVLSAGFGTRTGEAVLIDGRWRIARSTVCADLALAGVTCPPLPG